MSSMALELLETLGGERVRYIPRLGNIRHVVALVEPMRRTDSLGNQQFLTKTYDVWLVKDAVEGMTTIAVNVDTIALKMFPTDRQDTILKITKILPERDHGLPGDGVGMWHLEAVA